MPLVGVFVNAPAAEIAETVERAGLDLVQLSGDEGPDAAAPFAARAIKAFRTGGLPESGGAGGLERGLGGADRRAPPLALRRHRRGVGLWRDDGATAALAGRRLFLAGGIGPDNARRAVAAARPYAIDVCSRVESAPGIKDLELLRRLFQEVRHGETPTPP